METDMDCVYPKFQALVYDIKKVPESDARSVCVYPCPTSLFDSGQTAECSQPFVRSFSPTLHPPLPVFL